MKIEKTLILEIENLRLRIPTLEDIPHIFSATRYEGFNDGMLWDPPNNQEEMIEPYHNAIKAWEEDRAYSFSIEDKLDQDLLGRISIRKTKEKDRWNIGFWTHPKHQKKGVMSKALQIVLEFGFTRLNAEIIEACYALWNIGSEKVLKRNGMTFEKYIEKGFEKKGKWIEENLLSIHKEQWQQ